ncbi:MAG: bifunctional 3-deoxy-7-phosphoheptulonate synthase/chorismate mutase type II [Bacteroidia bacterium]|nr:bifunctional 3-deoxy-7-phosphoheptulonate synthase/chorismate mutase type II [Bacteroidia bacterium]
MKWHLNLTPVEKWFDPSLHLPLIISGPCSAETKDQMFSTAAALSKIPQVKVFRAGIWKPRTRPDSFEGVGKKGLQWLKEIKKTFGLLTTVEVAKPAHIEACLKHGIDILWIGARTSSNPFSVQELAEALKGVDIPVLVKNPVNPDIDLWIGSFERLNKTGITKLGAIFRGFYPYEKTQLRNIPKWEVAIELKSIFNNLPILCDSSHISGTTEYIQSISQKALDLNFDGLMIESHINPKAALSDAMQQLTPGQLKKLLRTLVFRASSSDNPEFMSLLEQYRIKIDSIDFELLELLSRRMKIVKEIGKYKSLNNVTILQLRRWENIMKTRTDFGEKTGLSLDFIKHLLELVHKESIQIQTEIMNRLKSKPDE